MQLECPVANKITNNINQIESLHIHVDHYELMLIVKGYCDVLIDKIKYHGESDNIFFITKWSIHEILNYSKDFEYYTIKFRTQDDTLIEILRNIDKKHSNAKEALNLIKKIIHEQVRKNPYYRHLVKTLIIQTNIILNRDSYTYNNIKGRDGKHDELFDMIENYIKKNIKKGIMIEDIANYCGYNKDYLYRLVKKRMGISLSKYISKIRFNIAVELMQETQMSISQISSALGFCDVQSYSRFVKNWINISPSKFIITRFDNINKK